MNANMETQLLRQKYQNNYQRARSNSLFAIVITLVSLVMMAAAEYVFLFSAYLPISLMEEGMFALKIGDDTAKFVLYAVLAAAVAVALLVFCLLSKKNSVWMIVLTVAYVLDTAIMIPDILNVYLKTDPRSAIFLVLYHAWVLFYLISGTVAALQLKKLPEEPAIVFDGAEEETVVDPFESAETANSTDTEQNG